MLTSFVHFQLFEVSTGPHQHLHVRFYNFICYLHASSNNICRCVYACMMFIPQLHLLHQSDLGSSLTEAAGWEGNDTAPSEDTECVSSELVDTFSKFINTVWIK